MRASAVRSSEAYWLLRNGIGDAGVALGESIDCDIAIIGAGITSALVADALIATGKRIVVLDSRDIAQGSTAASTALLQYEIDTHLVELTGLLGADAAMRAYLACAASFSLLEQRFPELLPLAGYERRASLYLASDDKAVPALRAELAARRGIGIACEWLDEEALHGRFRCRRPAAILSALGAQVDPFRLTRALFAGCVRHGVRLFARTKVTQVEEQGELLKLQTAGGHTVTASHVVVCAGYESLDFLPAGFADVNNTFALVTEPLARSDLATMPLMWESARPYTLSTQHARRATHRRWRGRAVQECRCARPAAAAADSTARGSVSKLVWRSPAAGGLRLGGQFCGDPRRPAADRTCARHEPPIAVRAVLRGQRDHL